MIKTCKNCGHDEEEHNSGDNSRCNHVVGVKKWKQHGLKVQSETFCPCKKFEGEDEIVSKNKCSRCGLKRLSDEEASLCEICDDEMKAEEDAYND